MITNPQFNIEIDKLTRSIESVISGESFKTAISKLTSENLKDIRKKDWLFDWKDEINNKIRNVYKLSIIGKPEIIQGLISLQDKGDHIYMHLIESSKFNRGRRKEYLGVPGNMVAFACKQSIDKGYKGFVSFESKSKLINHYQKTLGAEVLFNNIMAINTEAANKLLNQYFTENL